MVKTVAHLSGYEIDALYAVLNTNTVFNAVRETLCSDEEIRIFDKFVTMLNGADGLNVEATISEEELEYRQATSLGDGVIRGRRLTDQESRDAMFPEAPIWTDIGLLDPIETEAPPMNPKLEEQILRATEAIYDRLGITRSDQDILSRDELRKIVDESEKEED